MKSIALHTFCVSNNIPESFIEQLSTYELIEVIEIDSVKQIKTTELEKVQRLMRLHYDLNVNLEGIDIINNLLDRIQSLEETIRVLENENAFYR